MPRVVLPLNKKFAFSILMAEPKSPVYIKVQQCYVNVSVHICNKLMEITKNSKIRVGSAVAARLTGFLCLEMMDFYAGILIFYGKTDPIHYEGQRPSVPRLTVQLS